MSAATRSRKRRRRGRGAIYGVLLAAILLAGLGAAYTLWPPASPAETDSDESTGGDREGPAAASTALIFYIDAEGTALVSRPVPVPAADTPLMRARFIVERQLEPPEPPLFSPFPEGTQLRTIYLTPDGEAFVDLSRHASEGHPGGSLDELFTVYALVNALALNVNAVNAVQILVEGQEVDTLTGHVDLRRPLGLNLNWVSPDDAAFALAERGSAS